MDIKPDKKGVIVLGCGRSGTSAIACSMVCAGFLAGDDGELLGAAPSNKAGHYEPISVLRLNEELLRWHQSRWWAEVPAEATDERMQAAAAPRIQKVLDDLLERAEGAPIVVKEPRINGLLDLWGPIIEDSLHPVLAVRNPLEVARSLVRRDGNSLVNALAAWEVLSCAVLRRLDRKVVTVADYDELTRSPAAVTAIIDDVTTHLEPPRATNVDAARAWDALDPGLRNQDAVGIDVTRYLTGRQQQLWDFMRELPSGSTRLDTPEPMLRHDAAAARDAIRNEGDRLQLHGELAAVRADGMRFFKRLGQAELERDRLRAERDLVGEEKEAALHRAAEVEAELNAQLERTRAELTESQRAVATLLRSSSWRMTRPLRALKHDAIERRRSRRGSG